MSTSKDEVCINILGRKTVTPQGFAPVTSRSNIAAREYGFNEAHLVAAKESYFAG